MALVSKIDCEPFMLHNSASMYYLFVVFSIPKSSNVIISLRAFHCCFGVRFPLGANTLLSVDVIPQDPFADAYFRVAGLQCHSIYFKC